ncbi:MAG: hypothetical protein ACE5IP_10700 [Terriglobia bacterium]
MAKIWYLASGSRTVREERSLAWCIDKLWISPRDFRSPTPPHDIKGESVWVEVTEAEISQAPGYKAGFHQSFLSPSELEEHLRRL